MGFVGLLLFDIEKLILLLSLARCNIKSEMELKCIMNAFYAIMGL